MARDPSGGRLAAVLPVERQDLQLGREIHFPERDVRGNRDDRRREIDDRKIASIYGSLLRAGFPSDLIRKELKRLTQEEVAVAEVQEEL